MYHDLNVLWPSQFDAAGTSSKPHSKKEKKDANAKALAATSKQPDSFRELSPLQLAKMRAITEDLCERESLTICNLE
jgi:hypothetical protein